MNEGDDDISVGQNEDPAVLASPEALETSFFIDKPKHKHDSSQATYIVCNQQFSAHYRGKAKIDNHIKTKKHQHHLKSYDVNQQLIT
ncbi:unnamed protein product [Rotaria sp. Silwood1]|nr:unnamed protein product [Rotaria sp. Silwood1]CAF5123871.1 unnamed protein product [Rotaria sp. Silwood1]